MGWGCGGPWGAGSDPRVKDAAERPWRVTGQSRAAGGHRGQQRAGSRPTGPSLGPALGLGTLRSPPGKARELPSRCANRHAKLRLSADAWVTEREGPPGPSDTGREESCPVMKQ